MRSPTAHAQRFRRWLLSAVAARSFGAAISLLKLWSRTTLAQSQGSGVDSIAVEASFSILGGQTTTTTVLFIDTSGTTGHEGSGEQSA